MPHTILDLTGRWEFKEYPLDARRMRDLDSASWQIESAFSRNKRLLGSALKARTEQSRERECFLRILTHNLMIIRRAA